MILTKTKRKEYVRNLLDTIKVGKWFDEEEVYLFNNLTGYTYKKYKHLDVYVVDNLYELLDIVMVDKIEYNRFL